MRYVCDAPHGATWFRIETQAEADQESALMRHAVERYFASYHEAAREIYVPPEGAARFEEAIGLKDHIGRVMPLFLTLRADDGAGLATAMLPPGGRARSGFRIIIVGVENTDPYARFGPAIEALAAHYRIALPREACYPYA
jgi:hypothetical protein